MLILKQSIWENYPYFDFFALFVFFKEEDFFTIL